MVHLDLVRRYISDPNIEPDDAADADRTLLYGDLCLVLGRMSANKGARSSGRRGEKRIVHDQAGYSRRRKQEGLELAERLRGYGHPAWQRKQSVFLKWQSSAKQAWRSQNRKRIPGIVAESQAFLSALPRNAKVTVLIRSLDGLTTDIGSLKDFVRYVFEDLGPNDASSFSSYYFSLANAVNTC